MKQRRQRRQLRKKVRITDNVEKSVEQQNATVDAVEKVEAVETAVEQTPSPLMALGTSIAKEAQDKPEKTQVVSDEQTDNEEQEGTQRRNRRSPRHLRASGQRRRRMRDTRVEKSDFVTNEEANAIEQAAIDAADSISEMVNVVSIVEKPKTMRPTSGVAIPEMAMGKVWSRIKPAVEAPVEKNITQEKADTADMIDEVETNDIIINTPVVEAKSEIVAVETTTLSGVAIPEMAMGKVIPRYTAEETTVEMKSEPAPEQVIEKPVIVEEVAAPVIKTEETVEIKSPVTAVVDLPAVAKAVMATSPRGFHAASAMTKAPAPEEHVSGSVVQAAPLRERSNTRAAGSQTATNSAAAPMTKPSFD